MAYRHLQAASWECHTRSPLLKAYAQIALTIDRPV